MHNYRENDRRGTSTGQYKQKQTFNNVKTDLWSNYISSNSVLKIKELGYVKAVLQFQNAFWVLVGVTLNLAYSSIYTIFHHKSSRNSLTYM